jgi:AraC-like DNA-binding protein
MIKEYDTLLDILLKHAPEPKSYHTQIKGFWIAHRNTPNVTERCLVKPVVIVAVQGKKRFLIGKKPCDYNAGQTVVLGMDIPADSCVLEASPKKPYLSMLLDLDASIITQILAELPNENTDKPNLLAVACSETDPAVLEAFTRLSELLDKPEHIQYLSPLIIREIHYRLLTGPLGKHIRAIYTLGTQSNQITRAIAWLEKNYKAPLKVEKLADHVKMAVSTFHRNFKLIISLSPLQFQKKLRLLEAQRLMLTEGMDAVTASYEVGYESPTQFNREYKRMFGNSPAKDIKNIQLKTTKKTER